MIRETKRLYNHVLNLIVLIKRTLDIFDSIQVDSIKFKVIPHHFWREFKKDGWEPETYNCFKKNIKDNTTFIDIGAWVGVTLIWASVLGSKKIFAIEANPRSYKLLLKTINANDSLRESVTILNKCISDSSGDFVNFGKKLSSNSMISDKGDYRVETISLTKYLNLIKAQSNVFLKIDIEGAEELIIKDLILLKNTIKDIKIFLALHPNFWKNKTLACSEILNLGKYFKITYPSGEIMSLQRLEEMIMTENEFPEWGTSYGNLFEIMLISDKTE